MNCMHYRQTIGIICDLSANFARISFIRLQVSFDAHCGCALQSLPAALGGKNLVRPDSETPEQTAQANIAKAKQSSGNAVDSLKSGLGLQ